MNNHSNHLSEKIGHPAITSFKSRFPLTSADIIRIGSPVTEPAKKERQQEERARAMAKRQGLYLRKTRARTERQYRYCLVNININGLVFNSSDLADVVEYLTE